MISRCFKLSQCANTGGLFDEFGIAIFAARSSRPSFAAFSAALALVANEVGFVVPPSFETAFRPLLLGSPLAACIRPIDGFSIADFKEATVTRYVASEGNGQAGIPT